MGRTCECMGVVLSENGFRRRAVESSIRARGDFAGVRFRLDQSPAAIAQRKVIERNHAPERASAGSTRALVRIVGRIFAPDKRGGADTGVRRNRPGTR